MLHEVMYVLLVDVAKFLGAVAAHIYMAEWCMQIDRTRHVGQDKKSAFNALWDICIESTQYFTIHSRPTKSWTAMYDMQTQQYSNRKHGDTCALSHARHKKETKNNGQKIDPVTMDTYCISYRCIHPSHPFAEPTAVMPHQTKSWAHADIKFITQHT